jgi:hypothetical protein
MTQWGLDTLFNPAKRHMDEEKRRLQSTREEVGDSSGGKRIDLESGKVTIQRRTSAEDEPGTEDGPVAEDGLVAEDGPGAEDGARQLSDTPDDQSADGNGRRAKDAAGKSAKDKPAKAPSAAAIRAAQRRGRLPR